MWIKIRHCAWCRSACSHTWSAQCLKATGNHWRTFRQFRSVSAPTQMLNIETQYKLKGVWHEYDWKHYLKNMRPAHGDQTMFLASELRNQKLYWKVSNQECASKKLQSKICIRKTCNQKMYNQNNAILQYPGRRQEQTEISNRNIRQKYQTEIPNRNIKQTYPGRRRHQTEIPNNYTDIDPKQACCEKEGCKVTAHIIHSKQYTETILCLFAVMVTIMVKVMIMVMGWSCIGLYLVLTRFLYKHPAPSTQAKHRIAWHSIAKHSQA